MKLLYDLLKFYMKIGIVTAPIQFTTFYMTTFYSTNTALVDFTGFIGGVLATSILIFINNNYKWLDV